MKKKKKKRKPHLRVKIGLCGERKLNLFNIKKMLRGSLTSDKNKEDRSCWKVSGAHTLLMSEGDERFHIKNGLKRKRLEIPVKKRWQGESPSSE